MLYDKIKKICNQKGISVSFIEKEAGLSNGLISKWNESSPTIANLQAVATVLNVSIKELLVDDSEVV